MIKEIVNQKYLSEVFDFLPSDVILNKGVTGCGGSYLELHSNRNSVILVPTIELVKNKTEDRIQPIYGKITQQEIRDYLEKPGIKKLLGTYDSLERILDLIDPKEYFLLIDEYHLLFNAYNYRNTAVIKILKHYTDFAHFCFMSATPLNELCILKELEHLPQLTLEWKNSTVVNMNIIDTFYTNKALMKLIASDLNCNWHIFLNSVRTIRDIVNTGITDYRIICSETSKRGYANLKYATTKDPIAKYNFYTSCSFEGCDIYDPNGRTVIVCDTNIATTILDISTLIRQICGRLRNSIYKDEATLILNTYKHRYAKVSEWKFNNDLQNNIALGKRCEEQFKNSEGFDRILELRKYNPETFNSFYVNRIDDELFYDDNLRRMDEYNYHLVSEIYKSTISVLTECNNNNLQTIQGSIEIKGNNDWVKDILEDREYGFHELEYIFTPLLEARGLKWNSKHTIMDLFPEYTKRRVTINGVRDYYYTFKLS